MHIVNRQGRKGRGKGEGFHDDKYDGQRWWGRGKAWQRRWGEVKQAASTHLPYIFQNCWVSLLIFWNKNRAELMWDQMAGQKQARFMNGCSSLTCTCWPWFVPHRFPISSHDACQSRHPFNHVATVTVVGHSWSQLQLSPGPGTILNQARIKAGLSGVFCKRKRTEFNCLLQVLLPPLNTRGPSQPGRMAS